MALETRGHRVVFVMAAVVVVLAGALGFIIGLVGPAALRPVTLLGVWTLQPTPVGLAIYGSATIATVMAVGIALVTVASRFDDAKIA